MRGAEHARDGLTRPDSGPLAGYDHDGFWCELYGGASAPAPHAARVCARLARMDLSELRRRAQAAADELFNLGITFTIYSDRNSIDRILPFDVIPRILSVEDWRTIEAGVRQRVAALNAFLHDVYHEQRILKDDVVPPELVLGNANYRSAMQSVDLPHGTYVHVCGIDIVRDEQGALKVLEDNARTPSGVSYVIENRYLMQRAFPDLLAGIRVRKVDQYGLELHEAMTAVAPAGVTDPQVVLLSPGVFNAAYFEHVFLAREMGVPLVEPGDLAVDDERVYMKTTAGRSRVDVIYRRIDDDFLDPEAFRPDSLLGVRGLMRAYRRGRVSLANAVGTGVADDKAVYAYMPRIIEYYFERSADPRQCRDPHLPGARRPALHPGSPRSSWWSSRSGPRAATGSRSGRGRAAPSSRNAARRVAGRSGELHQPADGQALGLPDADQGRHRAAPRRSAAVRDHRRRHLGAARRPHPGRTAPRAR